MPHSIVAMRRLGRLLRTRRVAFPKSGALNNDFKGTASKDFFPSIEVRIRAPMRRGACMRLVAGIAPVLLQLIDSDCGGAYPCHKVATSVRQ